MDFQDRNSRQTAQVNTDSQLTELRTERLAGSLPERPWLLDGRK